MPNVNNPQGFLPSSQGSGGCLRLGEYRIDPTYAVKIYTGDNVKLVGGFLNVGTAAAPGIGVFKGCSFTRSDGSAACLPYWDGAADVDPNKPVIAMVMDDPDAIFEVQAASAAQADVGAVVQIVAGTGSTLYGNSGQSVIKNAAGKFVITGIVPRDDNEAGAFAKVFVVASAHQKGK